MALDLPLLGIVALGFAIEASIGFGAMIVSLSLGALVMPFDRVFVVVLPLNVVLSLVLAYRDRDAIARTLLTRRVLPFMILGVPIGALGSRFAGSAALVPLFGAMILLLALRELAALHTDGRSPAPNPLASKLALFVGGLVHGAFATGGPAVVWAVGSEIGDRKRAMRATISALWVMLNGSLCVYLATTGRIDRASLLTSGALFLSVAVGLAVGQLVHARLPDRVFRRAVFSMLGIAGTILLVR